MSTVRGVRCPSCMVGFTPPAGSDTLVREAGVVAQDGWLQFTDQAGAQTVVAYSRPIEITSAKSWQVHGDDGVVYTISKEGCGCRK